MKVRVIVMTGVLLLSAGLPLHSALHVAAANTTCLPTSSGEPLTPGVNFGLGELFATEDIQGTGDCLSATGDNFTLSVTIYAEFFNTATLTWQPTSCAPVSETVGSSSTTGNPGDPSVATLFESTGCNYLVGDPSLNTLHRAHTHLVTNNGVGPIDITSDPYLLASAG